MLYLSLHSVKRTGINQNGTRFGRPFVRTTFLFCLDDFFVVWTTFLFCFCARHSPKPNKDVNFFVNNIERQNAEGVVLLDLTGGPELVEGALCHPRKDVDHGV